jgi:hypothetical protein
MMPLQITDSRIDGLLKSMIVSSVRVPWPRLENSHCPCGWSEKRVSTSARHFGAGRESKYTFTFPSTNVDAVVG